MINREKFFEILKQFKQDFAGEHWRNERYKWKAVKRFQDVWDINAHDFLDMFMNATDETYNLLASRNNFPRAMIREYATVDAEFTRAMFINLFDETKDLIERIEKFRFDAEQMRVKYDNGTWHQHYQGLNAITTYLWLRYPDKYYIYKYSECRAVARALDADFVPQKGRDDNNILGSIKLYDEICELLKADKETQEVLKKCVSEDCYKDTEMKTLTIDFGYYTNHCLSDSNATIVDIENSTINFPSVSVASGKYSKDVFLSEVYMTEDKYDTLVNLLKHKKNIILQGAPGVGKTYTAKRLAYSIIGEKDESRIEFVQFHQNYSYEDFVMGYKPQGETFVLKEGIFYAFCKKASSMPDKEFFFIIDEINRGNLSKILGELMILIEKDYRGTEATLAYNDLPFSVPKNLYIIGMMNTADRSIAMIDYALRRRFSFFEIEPGFSSDGFKTYQKALENDTFDALIGRIIELNKEISTDGALGRGFCIGHSYFCGQNNCTEEWMREVVEYDIIPMLNEYWFDDRSKVQHWENNLRGVFND